MRLAFFVQCKSRRIVVIGDFFNARILAQLVATVKQMHVTCCLRRIKLQQFFQTSAAAIINHGRKRGIAEIGACRKCYCKVDHRVSAHIRVFFDCPRFNKRLQILLEIVRPEPDGKFGNTHLFLFGIYAVNPANQVLARTRRGYPRNRSRKSSIVWLNAHTFRRVYSRENVSNVVNDLQRVVAHNVGAESRADTFGAVDKNHGNNRRIKCRFHKLAIVVKVLENRIIFAAK